MYAGQVLPKSSCVQDGMGFHTACREEGGDLAAARARPRPPRRAPLTARGLRASPLCGAPRGAGPAGRLPSPSPREPAAPRRCGGARSAAGRPAARCLSSAAGSEADAAPLRLGPGGGSVLALAEARAGGCLGALVPAAFLASGCGNVTRRRLCFPRWGGMGVGRCPQRRVTAGLSISFWHPQFFPLFKMCT